MVRGLRHRDVTHNPSLSPCSRQSRQGPFHGANTYIGNAPNFMVKSIAEEAGSPCRASSVHVQVLHPDPDPRVYYRDFVFLDAESRKERKIA